MLGFLRVIFSYNIQQYVSNDEAHGKLLGTKDWQKKKKRIC
jgi:hypothetical protein